MCIHGLQGTHRVHVMSTVKLVHIIDPATLTAALAKKPLYGALQRFDRLEGDIVWVTRVDSLLFRTHKPCSLLRGRAQDPIRRALYSMRFPHTLGNACHVRAC